jgi:hypothetical protein
MGFSLGAFCTVVMLAPGATDILIADNKERDDLVVLRAVIEIYYTVSSAFFFSTCRSLQPGV